jgi:3-deoxy-D-manno-octulosonic-acid transferase
MMAKLLYQVVMVAYGWAARLVAIWDTKAQLFVNGRRGWQSVLEGFMEQQPEKQLIAWFHCASLGEFEQARPVIEAFREQYPRYKVVLTFYSPSGYEVRKGYDKADLVMYLPLDTRSNAKKFVTLLRPSVVFFVKYEFWYHYLHYLSKRKIPVYSISAIFRENHIFFKPWGGFFRRMLKLFTYILVQDVSSLQLLKDLGLKQVALTGDTRFDRVYAICQSPRHLPPAEYFSKGYKVLVIGSSWPADITLLAPFVNRFAEPLKIIVAPHELEEEIYQDIREKFHTKQVVNYSAYNPEKHHAFDVLIVDNMGNLSSLYQYADFAWVGGAFGKGLHNTLEPATYGIPIFFGSKFSKFKEAIDLVSLECAFSVDTVEAFEKHFLALYHDPELYGQVGNLCARYVKEHCGATEKIMQIVAENTNLAT